jgi:hypothetical protein
MANAASTIYQQPLRSDADGGARKIKQLALRLRVTI